MRKLKSLRDAIVATIPGLAGDPERLVVFVEAGNVVAYYSSNDSHRIDYTATLCVWDFAGDIGVISATICNWLKTEQPDLLLNPDKMRDAVTFEVELTSHTTMDVVFRVKLEERVVVTDVVSWPAEPSLQAVDPQADITLLQLFVESELVAGSENG